MKIIIQYGCVGLAVEVMSMFDCESECKCSVCNQESIESYGQGRLVLHTLLAKYGQNSDMASSVTM